MNRCLLTTFSVGVLFLANPPELRAQNLVGTTWSGSESLSGYGRLTFEFYGGGRAVMIDTSGRTSGSWSRSGNSVTLRFHQTVVYRGTIRGTVLSGSGSSKNRSNWSWSVTREGGHSAKNRDQDNRESARIQAQQRARKQAQDSARQKAREKAQRLARQKEQQQAREKAKRLAQQKAREKARQLARQKEQQQAREKAKRLAQQRAREKAQQLAQRKAREKAQQQAREKAQQKARQKTQNVARQLTPSRETQGQSGKGKNTTVKALKKKVNQKQANAQNRLNRLKQTTTNLLAGQKQFFQGPTGKAFKDTTPDWDKIWDDLLNRSFVDFTWKRTLVDPDATSAAGPFDVVFTYSWGGVSHHQFSDLAKAKEYAAKYTEGAYSIADKTLQKIAIYAIGKEKVDPVKANRLVFDENATKRKQEDAIRSQVKKAVENDPIRKLLVEYEGVRINPYQDTAKPPKLTTAIGFNLEAAGAAERLEAVKLDPAKVAAGVQIPTAQQMLQLLDLGVDQARKWASGTAVFGGDDLGLPLVPKYDKLTTQQQGVMINMLFNMGPGGAGNDKGFGGFKGLRKALDAGDPLQAAVEMIDSAWYDQVRNKKAKGGALIGRSPDLVEMMGLDRPTQKAIYDIIQQRKKGSLDGEEAKDKINDLLQPIRDRQQQQQNPLSDNSLAFGFNSVLAGDGAAHLGRRIKPLLA
jgi:hypothetical protein